MALIHVGFFSQTLGMCVNCDVILPQTQEKRVFPVLWLLHGKTDNHTSWQRLTSIERYVEGLDLAVVMPDGELSKYADMAHGGKYFTYITQELPRMMRSFFPLSDQREENFVAGMSMGGFGCLKIGLACPEQYGAIGCLSAGAEDALLRLEKTPKHLQRIEMIYGDREIAGTEEDILGNARRIVAEGKPAPRLYQACGSSDFLLQDVKNTRDFFQSLPGNPFDYVYEEGPGAHTWEFWDEYIQHFLRYLNLKKA